MKPRPFKPRPPRRARDRAHSRVPLLEIFRDHGRSLFVGFCVAVLWAVAVYVLMIFLPTYVQQPAHLQFQRTPGLRRLADRQHPIRHRLRLVRLAVGSHRPAPQPVPQRGAAAAAACCRCSCGSRPRPTLPTLIASQCTRLHSGGELRRRRAGGAVGDLPDRRALDRHVSGLQRRVHGVRRLRAHDSDLAHAAIGRVDLLARLVCHAGGGESLCSRFPFWQDRAEA